MAKPEVRKEWEQHVAAYRSSSQTTAQWCKENNVGFYALKYWISKLKKETATTVSEPT